MSLNMVIEFLRGLAFLSLVSLAVAIPISALLKDRWQALLFASGISTLIINTWIFLTQSSLDIPFLIHVIVVSTTVTILVVSLVNSLRRRPAGSD